MVTAELVAQEFARVRPLVDNGDPRGTWPVDLPGIEDAGEIVEQLRRECLAEMQVLVRRVPLFIRSGAFDWVVDPTIYSDHMEVMMQRDLLVILSAIAEDDPDLQRLGSVAVKWVSNPYFASVCVPGETVSFICLSGGFATFLQVVVGTLVKLHDFAERNDAPPTERTNYLFGGDAERALRVGGEEVSLAIRVLIGNAIQSVSGDIGGLDAPLTPRLASDVWEQSPLLAYAYQSCELFIVLHELGHLLNGDDHRLQRTLAVELRADRTAQRLLKIGASKLNYAGSFYVGPTFYLQVARLYDLIRRTYGGLRHVRGAAVSAQGEFELHKRLSAAIAAVPSMGFPASAPRIALMEALANEMYVLIAGCQFELFRLLETPRSLESLLPPPDALTMTLLGRPERR